MSIAPQPSRAGTLPAVGGVLALDFCNTSSGRGTPDHLEHLRCITDLLAWAQHAGVIDEHGQASLGRRWESDARQADGALSRALGLRDAIHCMVSQLATGQEPDRAAVETVGREHAACLAKGRLAVQDGGFGWHWSIDEAPAEAVLGPIAASAMALVTTADRARLKQCSGHHCGWLFLDTTKSNNRRWCEMEVCGNRAKQKRRRKRASASAA